MHVDVDMIRTGYQIVNEQNLVQESHLCDKTMIIDNKEQMLKNINILDFYGILL